MLRIIWDWIIWDWIIWDRIIWELPFLCGSQTGVGTLEKLHPKGKKLVFHTTDSLYCFCSVLVA